MIMDSNRIYLNSEEFCWNSNMSWAGSGSHGNLSFFYHLNVITMNLFFSYRSWIDIQCLKVYRDKYASTVWLFQHAHTAREDKVSFQDSLWLTSKPGTSIYQHTMHRREASLPYIAPACIFGLYIPSSISEEINQRRRSSMYMVVPKKKKVHGSHLVDRSSEL